MLLYKLRHFDDEFKDVKLNVINRDKELTHSLISLFFSTNALGEIIRSLAKTQEDNNTAKTTSTPGWRTLQILEVKIKIKKGSHHSIQSRLKIAAALRTEENREKIIAANIGKKRSKETCKNYKSRPKEILAITTPETVTVTKAKVIIYLLVCSIESSFYICYT